MVWKRTRSAKDLEKYRRRKRVGSYKDGARGEEESK